MTEKGHKIRKFKKRVSRGVNKIDSEEKEKKREIKEKKSA